MYLNQNFFYTKFLSVKVLAESEKNFIVDKYGNMQCSAYLSFEKNTIYNKDTKTKEKPPSVLFSYHNMYELIKELIKVSVLLEKKEEDIFYLNEENNMIEVTVEYSKEISVIKSFNKTLGIGFGVGVNEYTNTEEIGVVLYIESKTNPVFIPGDKFLSLVFTLKTFNLLQSSQLLINNYLNGKIMRYVSNSQRQVVEEG